MRKNHIGPTTGKFGYTLNCSLPHFVLSIVADGYPVIVFPSDAFPAQLDTTYRFVPKLTANAIYAIDGKVYRVAHAGPLDCLDRQEGTRLDAILNRRSGPAVTGTLADRLGGDLEEQLRSAVHR